MATDNRWSRWVVSCRSSGNGCDSFPSFKCEMQLRIEYAAAELDLLEIENARYVIRQGPGYFDTLLIKCYVIRHGPVYFDILFIIRYVI